MNHKEMVTKFGSVEAAAEAAGIDADAFETVMEVEERFGTSIEVPSYFKSYAKALEYFGTTRKAAAYAGIPKSTFHDRLKREKEQGVKFEYRKDSAFNEEAPAKVVRDAAELKDELVDKVIVEGKDNEIKYLKKELKELHEDVRNIEKVKEQLFGIKDPVEGIPGWLQIKNSLANSSNVTGIPVVMVTDWHIGEVIDSSGVDGLNSYDPNIAMERLGKLTHKTVNLLTQHMVKPDYPGIIVCLGGDLVSGDIHDELVSTNGCTTYEAIQYAFSGLTNMIKEFKAAFGNVVVFSVPGNHGRSTKKPWAKHMAKTNADWLIASLLEREFTDDGNVDIVNSANESLAFSVYGTKFNLTHGAQYRGGHGFLGSAAPILRGNIKRKAALSSSGREYDIMLMGHHHTYVALQNVICGGSIVGYSEYAKVNDFPYEPPTQAMFVVHPDHGITFNLPAYLGESKKGWDSANKEVVSWFS